MKNITIALICALALTACESIEEQALVYHAWCKTHECKDLTQAEFQALRENHLLPGQPPPDDSSANAAIAGVMAGAVAGSLSTRGR